MAKSFTVLQKDIADSLRFQTLTQPPEVVELSKLSEDIEKILKKPHNYIQTGPILDEYYSKLIRMMTVMKDVNQKSFGSSENTIGPAQPPSTPVSANSTVPTPPAAAAAAAAQPSTSTGQPSPTTSAAATPATPQFFATPGSDTPFGTPQPSSSQGVRRPHKTPSSKTPASQKSPPHKKDLLEILQQTDDSFLLHSDGKTITLNHKSFPVRDFNRLYTKLQDPSMTRKQHKSLSNNEKKMFEIIKENLQKTEDSGQITELLPGMAQFLFSPSPQTAQQRRQRAHSSVTPKRPVTPVTTRSRNKKLALLAQTAGKGLAKKIPSSGKIHFKRWSSFVS